MKKLLLLGGSRYLLPVIREAKELGLYTITCDYLPDNIAHRYSDAYHNVSITDLEATKKLAGDLGVDGVMSFACDPGVVTAPMNPSASCRTRHAFAAFCASTAFGFPGSAAMIPWKRH